MIKTLSRHGNGHALVLGADILRLHGISPKTKIQIATTGESIVLTPIRPSYDEAFEKAFKFVLRRHHKSLLALSQE